MRLLFVVDGRSPIALNWIEYFLSGEHEVHLASTFACPGDARLASSSLVPVAFSGMKTSASPGNPGAARSGLWGASLVGARTTARQWLGPLTLRGAARRLKQVIDRVQPDLVHAMRIPYEGMLAALANPVAPLLISVWGNDFTLHAPATPLMGHYTRLALRRADALHADCQRDVRLAHAWEFDARKPSVVLPGAGGIQLDLFYPAVEVAPTGPRADTVFTVVNPRGVRAYVRNDTFFRAIPLVLARLPGVRFICPTMAGEPQAASWVRTLGISQSVELLPTITRSQMADLFRRAQVAVSPSTHDGTPNTLLEAMACGCFPIAGDIESLREWITPSVNGLLFDPGDPRSLADALLSALGNPELRHSARQHNLQFVAERAAYPSVMAQALDFYRSLVGKKN